MSHINELDAMIAMSHKDMAHSHYGVLEMKQTEDKLLIRLPDGLRDTIKKSACENERTMNAEVVYRLKRSYGAFENKNADA